MRRGQPPALSTRRRFITRPQRRRARSDGGSSLRPRLRNYTYVHCPRALFCIFLPVLRLSSFALRFFFTAAASSSSSSPRIILSMLLPLYSPAVCTLPALLFHFSNHCHYVSPRCRPAPNTASTRGRFSSSLRGTSRSLHSPFLNSTLSLPPFLSGTKIHGELNPHKRP